MTQYALGTSCRLLAQIAFLVSFACPLAATAVPHLSETYGRLPLHFEANQGSGP
jgi:hypothetical protein